LETEASTVQKSIVRDVKAALAGASTSLGQDRDRTFRRQKFPAQQAAAQGRKVNRRGA